MQDLTQRLQQLSSAEDFFEFFGLPYDAQVVRVNRLHILKRFQQYVRQEQGLDALGEVDTYARYRSLLQRAHADLAGSSGVQERMFKVFKDADGQQHVSVDALRATLRAAA